ncbi:helicase, partial [Dendrothele bispora CBS 962.96]
ISINKAQGQSVIHVGIDLRVPVFTHGQLYVAFSRATSCARVKVLLPEKEPLSQTKNIVYPEVLI